MMYVALILQEIYTIIIIQNVLNEYIICMLKTNIQVILCHIEALVNIYINIELPYVLIIHDDICFR